MRTLYYTTLLQYTFSCMNYKKSSTSLPPGFADHLLQFQMRLDDQSSLQLYQTLAKLYKICVQFYLENDLKKAEYFQKKLNIIAVKSIEAHQLQNKKPRKICFQKKMKEQVQKIQDYKHEYLASIVNQSHKSQKRIQQCVQADLSRQEQQFQSRMLQRIKSSGKL